MSDPKILDNLDEPGNIMYSVKQPYAVFTQTSGSSGIMSTGVAHTVRPSAGSGPLNIWDNLLLEGGISIGTTGTITFSQSGYYMAVYSGAIGVSVETGRLRLLLVKQGLSVNQFWLYNHTEISTSSTTCFTCSGAYPVNAGDKFDLIFIVDDAYSSSQVMISQNKLTLYMI